MSENGKIEAAVRNYMMRNSLNDWHPEAALIDMDGVLYDSMPGHAKAWRRLMLELDIDVPESQFFLYEGMTGVATIELLLKLNDRPEMPLDDIRKLYARKGEYFRAQGERKPMPGASEMLSVLINSGVDRVLVTGSAQASLLASLEKDYPGAFSPDKRVTALDVNRGKPHPEPYLAGLKKAGVEAHQAIVIENAPLGVEAGSRAGCFTIGLTTGPVPADALTEAGADITFSSMTEFAKLLPELLCPRVRK